MAKKTYNEKLNNSGDMPKVVVIDDPKKQARYKANTMLLAPPLEYDAVMKAIPCGKVTTSDRIMDYLACKHGADMTCPMTAGMFINIAAHASRERGGVDETPYWRTLRKDGELNEKYPDGMDGQKILLESEGHTVIQKGKRYFVAGYAEKVFVLPDGD